MTEDQYAKLVSGGIMAACFAVPLFTIPPELTRSVSYALTMGGLAVAGVFAMILALIGLMKKYISGKSIVPVAAFGVVVLWGVISMIAGNDFGIGMYGFTGRGEGVLALLFYFSFFTMCASAKREKVLSSIASGLIFSGLFHSIFALIQVFGKSVGFYRYADLRVRINAASGLAHSPLFLAVYLTFAMIAALFGIGFFKEKWKKIIAWAALCLMSFIMVFTYTFIGFCGLGLALIALFIAVFAGKALKLTLTAALGIVVPAVLGIVLVNAGAIGSISSYRLYDGRLLWWADSYIRLSASGDFDPERIDIDDTYDVYATMNAKALRIAGEDPLTGTGPDQMIYPQIYKTDFGDDIDRDLNDIIALNKGAFDRVYNEYINVAATRGIPSAIAVAAVLILSIAGGISSAKKRRSWQPVMATAITVTGALLFLICCSSMAFAPIFWCTAGACCAVFPREE